MSLRFFDRVSEATSAYTSASFTIATAGAWSNGFQNCAKAGFAASDTAYFAASDSSGNAMTFLGAYTAGSIAITSVLTSSAGGTTVPTFSGAVTLEVVQPAQTILPPNAAVFAAGMGQSFVIPAGAKVVSGQLIGPGGGGGGGCMWDGASTAYGGGGGGAGNIFKFTLPVSFFGGPGATITVNVPAGGAGGAGAATAGPGSPGAQAANPTTITANGHTITAYQGGAGGPGTATAGYGGGSAGLGGAGGNATASAAGSGGAHPGGTYGSGAGLAGNVSISTEPDHPWTGTNGALASTGGGSQYRTSINEAPPGGASGQALNASGGITTNTGFANGYGTLLLPGGTCPTYGAGPGTDGVSPGIGPGTSGGGGGSNNAGVGYGGGASGTGAGGSGGGAGTTGGGNGSAGGDGQVVLWVF